MKLILIRHGMTPGNEKKHYLGVTDEHLSEAGRAALEENKKKGLYPKPDAVFVSPMEDKKKYQQDRRSVFYH